MHNTSSDTSLNTPESKSILLYIKYSKEKD